MAVSGGAGYPTFTVLTTFNVPAGNAEIVSATADGRYLAVSAGDARKITLLDLLNPAMPVQVCVVDTAMIGEPTSVAVHPSGAFALTAVTLERARAVIVFDVTNPQLPAVAGFVKVGTGNSAEPEGITYLPSRRRLITANEGQGSITVICVDAGQGPCA